MTTKNTDFNFSIKSMQEDGVFAGYASVFGMVDTQNDVVMQGAFARTLRKRKGQVKLLWQHLVQEPIGVFKTIREDAHGLYVEGQLLIDLQRGKEAYLLLKSGAIRGLSIGYNVVAADYNGENNIRLITEVELWEVSLVTFPANEGAMVTQVKHSGDKEGRAREPLLHSIDRAIAALGVN